MTSVFDTVVAQFEGVVSALLQPTQFLSDPSKRIFWAYLVVSVLLAGLVFAFRDGRRWSKHLYENLLSPRLWFHPSSRVDFKLMLVKSLVRTLLFASWLVSSHGLAVGVVRFANDQFGPASGLVWSATAVTIVYTVVLFVSSDFSRYLVHRLCHQVPLLWQFHQVHHSAEVMTPLTLYRSHPVENLIFVLRGIVVMGSVTGVFYYLFGTQAVQVQILGVNALGLLFNMLGANLRHSHVWISYGSVVERVLLSPAQHQLHHSKAPRHYGANYGSCLAIWDWLGGSLHLAKGQKGLRFGVADTELNHDPHALGSTLLGPFRGCWRLIAGWVRARLPASRVECD